MNQTESQPLHQYFRAVASTYATGHATEHSYRPALKALLEIIGGDGVEALNEPKKGSSGAPDFIVLKNGIPVGHVECKDVDTNLAQVQEGEQLRRYRDGLPNLILTDHLEFRWYTEGEPRTSVRIGNLTTPGKLTIDNTSGAGLAELIGQFLQAGLPVVDNPHDLARRLASKARLMRYGIARLLEEEAGSGPLHDLMSAYRKTLIEDLTCEWFADLQAQTVTYGMFAARWQHDEKSGRFTRQVAVFRTYLKNPLGLAHGIVGG